MVTKLGKRKKRTKKRSNLGSNLEAPLVRKADGELKKDLTPLCPASKTQERDDEKNVSFLND